MADNTCLTMNQHAYTQGYPTSLLSHSWPSTPLFKTHQQPRGSPQEAVTAPKTLDLASKSSHSLASYGRRRKGPFAEP
jgi:hypothetical protein